MNNCHTQYNTQQSSKQSLFRYLPPPTGGEGMLQRTVINYNNNGPY